MIVGAGAVGGSLACRLQDGGHDVSIVARGPHLAAIKANGLRLRSLDAPEKTVYLNASDAPEALGAQDLVVTTVKAPALPNILNQIRPVIEAGTPVITAMNGIFWWYGHGLSISGSSPDTSRLDPGGGIAAILPVDQTMGAVIHSTNRVVEPGVILNRSSNNKFVLGSATAETSEIAESLAPRLTVPGLRFEAHANICMAMWHKLLRNLSTAPSSVLTGGEAFDVLNDNHAKNVARSLFLEGAAVAAAHGFQGLERDVDQVFRPGAGAHQKPSMCQDYDLGRPMEIDNMLRIVQDFARQSDVLTPTLDTVVALVILRARLAGCYPRQASIDPEPHRGPSS